MSPRSVLILAAATLVACVVAVIAVLQEPATGRIVVDGEPAFPTLRADPDAVAEITIRQAGDEVVLERTAPGSWVSRTHDGYPAATDRVRALVVTLSDMQLVEAKTSDPERFARLEVEDPDAEDARSRLVTLTDSDGAVLTEVLIGKDRNRLTGTEPAGTYIRRPGEDQSWLATGRVDLPPEPDVWLQRQIVDLPAEQVIAVEVTPPDGPPYTLRRAEEGEGWVLVDAEGERQVPEAADPLELAGALAALQHQGVEPAGEVAWPETPHRVRFTTDDGLEVTVRAAEVDDQRWITVEAAPLAEEAVAHAEAISGRTGGWAYALPASAFRRLTLPHEEWTGDGTS